MPQQTTANIDALEKLSRSLLSVFEQSGHEFIAPAIIQPADVFLDAIGETLRARTYVFTDPDGAELCLRPDLTVPACRYHVARNLDAAKPAAYCYNATAFRFQPQGVTAVRPREFRQVGLERFGEKDREKAEALVVSNLLNALETVGAADWQLRMSDFGLFQSVLQAAEIPTRWQTRLAESFLRPELFAAELDRLKTDPGARAKKLDTKLLSALAPEDIEASEKTVARYLSQNGVEWIGVRTIREMTASLIDIVKDVDARPLEPQAAKLIEDYARLRGSISDIGGTVAKMVKSLHGTNARIALDVFDRRLALLANAGIDLTRVEFAAEFGRDLGYYTGLVFEVVLPGLGPTAPVAGGGRYDKLIRYAGAVSDVPAVGAAIHAERLLAIKSEAGQ